MKFIKRICRKGQLPHISIVCISIWQPEIFNAAQHIVLCTPTKFEYIPEDPFSNHWGYLAAQCHRLDRTIKICFTESLLFVFTHKKVSEFHYSQKVVCLQAFECKEIHGEEREKKICLSMLMIIIVILSESSYKKSHAPNPILFWVCVNKSRK